MIRVDDKIYFDHIDRQILDEIASHPDIRQADLLHHCPLSNGGAWQRLLKLSNAGYIVATNHGLRSTSYRIAVADEKMKKEDEVPASPKHDTHNARSSIP